MVVTLAAGSNYYNGPDVWKALGAGGIAAIVIAVLVAIFVLWLYSRRRGGPGRIG